MVLSIDGKTLLFCIPGLAKEDIAIPEGTAAIAVNAFVGCENLNGIRIPDSVKTIGNSAFYGCSGLTGLTLPDKVRKIDKTAFENCDRTKLTICATVGSYAEEFTMENSITAAEAGRGDCYGAAHSPMLPECAEPGL